MKRKVVSGLMLTLLLIGMLTLAFNIQPVKASSESGLVGYWKFDEGSGTTAMDSSGNGNTGTLNNGPTWVDGKYAKALSFDGVDDYVQVPQSSSLDVTAQVTVEAWVYPRAYVSSEGDNSHIVSRVATNGGSIYVLMTYSSTSTKAGYAVNQVPYHHASSADLPLNAWTHLAMTYDGANVKLYMNGQFDSSYAQSGPIETTSNWLAIGCKPPASAYPPPIGSIYAFFNGIIDEVRIYNRALSQQEIQNDMGAQQTQSSTSIVCSPNPVSGGSPVTCTTTVSGSNPTGTVSWSTNSSTGSFTVSSCTLFSGRCSTAYTDMCAGSVTITATYSGDSKNSPSSGSTTLTVTSSVPGFTMYWASPFYGVTAGSETSFVINLEYSKGFAGTVTLSVQDLPNGCTGSFDIAQLSPPVSYRTLTVITPSSLSNGTYTFMVKGESGNLYRMIPVTLTVGTGEITGVVFRDDNGNGIRDLGEPVVSGATIGYWATQNYVNLYQAGATSDSNGEFTLVNVPFNVDNEVDVMATGLEMRSIKINIMNQPETHLDIGMSTPPASGWKTCTQFDIASLSVSFSQYLLPFVQAYNLVNFLSPINTASINSLPPVNLYMITPSSSTDQAEFTQALSQYLSITAPAGFNPACVFILDFPFLQTINALFGTNIQGPITLPIPFSGASILLSAQSISTTPKGSVVLALTFSKTAESAKGLSDLLQALAETLETVAKMDPVNIIKDGVDLFKATIETLGEDSISVITSDLDQSGQLVSYTLLDMVHMADTLSALTTAGGLVNKVIHLSAKATEAALTGGLDVPDDVRAILRLLDLTVEVLPYMPAMSFLKNNTLYQLFMTGEGMIVSAVDPNGTTIAPSFYNSLGSLVMGYNSTSGNIIYASKEGILIPEAGDWMALLNESASEPMNYSICLNAVGGNASVPYNLQILSSNQNVTAIGYSGIILRGTSITLPINVAVNDTLIQQVYLKPMLSVSETGNVLDFVATGTLSNGSLVPVTKAFLIVNGSQYEMAPDNASTFEIQLGLNFPEPVQFYIYMISPNTPGGFATGMLQHDLAVTSLTSSKTIVGQGYGDSINVTAANEGSYTETFKVTVFANATSIASQNITLSIGNSATTTFIWNTTGFPRGRYTIKVQVTLAPSETNTANNTYTGGWVEVRLRGLVTPPSPTHTKVTLADFGKLKLIYSQVYPYKNPPYDVNHPETYYYLTNPATGKVEYLMPDINGDGKITFADVGLLKLIYSGYFP